MPSESLRVQVSVPRTQFHPVPVIETAVNPVGSVSVTVMVPAVTPGPLFSTSMVYFAGPPTAKLPGCVLVTLSTGDKIPQQDSHIVALVVDNRQIGSVRPG